MIKEGKKDKALKALDYCSEVIPSTTVPHDYIMSSSKEMADDYLALGEKEKRYRAEGDGHDCAGLSEAEAFHPDVPSIQNYLFFSLQVEYCSSFRVQAQFFVVVNFCFRSIETYEIRFSVVSKFFSSRVVMLLT